MTKKKVAVQLPGIARAQSVRQRYEPELEALGRLDLQIVEVEAASEEELIEGFRDADAIMTSWGVRISERVISQLERCVIIGVGSVGVDMVDVDAATAAGIVVTNVPDVFIEEVADHTMMLLLASARRVKQMDSMAARGDWYRGRPVFKDVPRLWGQVLGLLSFGNVARAVARRARPFGMHLIAHDPYVSELKMTGEGVEPVGFGELLDRSDYLSLHAALNAETHHIIAARELARMKDSAVLINAGRGPLVDEQALTAALAEGRLAAAGLDVLEQEPPQPDNPLLRMETVVITPHVASATSRMRDQTRRRVGREVALALSGRWPMSCVNPTVLPRVPLERWQPVSMERGPNR